MTCTFKNGYIVKQFFALLRRSIFTNAVSGRALVGLAEVVHPEVATVSHLDRVAARARLCAADLARLPVHHAIVHARNVAWRRYIETIDERGSTIQLKTLIRKTAMMSNI